MVEASVAASALEAYASSNPKMVEAEMTPLPAKRLALDIALRWQSIQFRQDHETEYSRTALLVGDLSPEFFPPGYIERRRKDKKKLELFMDICCVWIPSFMAAIMAIVVQAADKPPMGFKAVLASTDWYFVATATIVVWLFMRGKKVADRLTSGRHP